MLTQVRAGSVRPGWRVTIVAPAADASDPSAALEQAADAALVDACLAGRREAFDVIVTRYRRQVYQLCYRFVGNHEDASDLAQEVFIRAYRALGKFRGRSSLPTWLYRIGVNVSLNKVSAKRPVSESLADTDRLPAPAESPVDALLRGERAVRVRAAIQRLPKKQRAALILRVYHELPHEEIASIVGSSVGAVKANLFHALNNLKKRLGDI